MITIGISIATIVSAKNLVSQKLILFVQIMSCIQPTYLQCAQMNILVTLLFYSVYYQTCQGRVLSNNGLNILLYLVITVSIINNESFVIIPI